MRDWHRRLDRLQQQAESDATVLVLGDGTRVTLPRAASLNMFLAIGGVHPTEPVAAWIDLFARSVSQDGEGQMTRFCRFWCRRRLGLSTDHLADPELIFGGERWAARHDVHAEVENYIEEAEASR